MEYDLLAVVIFVCGALLLLRVPAAVRQRGRGLLLAGFLAVGSFVLVSPDVYAGLDAMLPGVNSLDPVAKALLSLAFLLLGDQVVSNGQHPVLSELLGGRTGRWVLVCSLLLELCFFTAAKTSRSSPGLEADVSSPLVALYSGTLMAYLSWVAILVLAGLALDDRDYRRARRTGVTHARPPMDVVALGLLVTGFGLVPVRLILVLPTCLWPDSYGFAQALSACALAAVALGLFSFWISRLLFKRGQGAIHMADLLRSRTPLR